MLYSLSREVHQIDTYSVDADSLEEAKSKVQADAGQYLTDENVIEEGPLEENE